MFQLPHDEKAMVDALSWVSKEMLCLDNESISIKVSNYQVLDPINLKIIEKKLLRVIFPLLMKFRRKIGEIQSLNTYFKEDFLRRGPKPTKQNNVHYYILL